MFTFIPDLFRMAYEAWVAPPSPSSSDSWDSSKLPWFGKRHILALLAFVGIALSYAIRFNLSIAIVAMINSTTAVGGSSSVGVEDFADKNSSIETSGVEICPSDAIYRADEQGNNQSLVQLRSTPLSPQFNWDEPTRGIILGSFFWGYICTQLPGGLLAQRFGGKWLFGFGQLIAAIAGLLIPTLAPSGPGWIVGIRVVQGLCGGVIVPATHSLIAHWIPPEERGRFSTLIYAGMPFGSAITLLISGYVTHYLGWEAVFHITGAITIFWFVLWSIMTFGSPHHHPTISESEFNFIKTKIGGSMTSSATGARLSTPWRSIFTSVRVWAILITHPCCTWGHYTMLIQIPSFLKTALHFDMKNNAWISAGPHLLSWIFSLILIYTGDALVTRGLVSTGTVRKINMTFALWGSALLSIGVAYSGCNYVATVLLLTFAVGAIGGVYGGVLCNHIDIAPNFAGVLLGMSNTLATVPGFLSPAVAGIILDGDVSIGQWRKVFLTCAGIQIFGNFVYLLLGSGEEQKWNRTTSPSPSIVEEIRQEDIKSAKEIIEKY